MDSKQNPWRVEIKETPPNEMEKYSLYSDYTTNQKQGFLEIIKLVDRCISELQDDGELTGYVKINARIKSAESALRNDDIEDKALDDAFGMEILAGNENALKKIATKLEEYMNVRREKKHDKENGYKATHRMLDLKKTMFERLHLNGVSFQNIPMIEVQFKTFEVKENATSGPANHMEYKGKTKEEMQAIYDNNGFTEHNLPIMYTIENHRIRILNKQETIRDLYPFIKLKSREKEGEAK